ncbi:MAG: AAA family ATPase [Clostridia bacterium]|nr:AAA family ATPase [Clostridia bacterium]
MTNPFDKIIGYKSIRKELERTADALKNTEKYARLGTSAPKGLLLHGEPGVGKTLMATCLIEASGRKAFMCRKDRPEREFIEYIRVVFEQARQDAPSIVFLDDLDKFANADEYHKNTEEYVTVQSCMDNVKSSGVFVFATANDIENLPESLLRTGRFDRIIKIDSPTGEDAVNIVRHYLKDKRLVAEADAETVAGIMSGLSCAALETAVNKAGLLAGYENSETITMRHLILGCMDISYDVSPDSIISGTKRRDAMLAAYHETGHALVSEIICPGSVSAICIFENNGRASGVTSYVSKEITELDDVIDAITCSMGGLAGTKHKFGIKDIGAESDLYRARSDISRLISDNAAYGFFLKQSHYEFSTEMLSRMEQIAADKVEECYSRAQRMISENNAFFEAIAAELLKKGLLVAKDIKRIRRKISAHETFLSHQEV